MGVPEEEEEEEDPTAEHNDIKRMMVRLLLLEIHLFYSTHVLSVERE